MAACLELTYQTGAVPFNIGLMLQVSQDAVNLEYYVYYIYVYSKHICDTMSGATSGWIQGHSKLQKISSILFHY